MSTLTPTAENTKTNGAAVSPATSDKYVDIPISGTPVATEQVIKQPEPAQPAPANPVQDDDDDPHNLIIASLRAQNTELFSQVTALNAKLVKSYDRVSDLEDSAHLNQAQLKQANLRVSELELERLDHMKAVNTGLLVEREHVTSELTRLMEKVTEEAARRGQAESARSEIEKDLDDLSASLFDQANTMVAQARLDAARSERKVAESELALKSAEEVVSLMQSQLQALQESKEKAEEESIKLRELMTKGKWVERPSSSRRASSIILGLGGTMPRLMSGHLPYEEFHLFVAHLRGIRPTMLQAPAFSSLFGLPFLSRLIAEDSDPTLRLDLAPSLNWLTRRSIQAAVQQGQLQVEPLSATSFLLENATHSHGLSSASNSPADICCALCGKAVFPASLFTSPPSAWKEAHPSPPHHPSTRQNTSISGTTWMASTSRFLKSMPSLTSSSQQSNSQPQSRNSTAPSTPLAPPSPIAQHQVFVFRLSLSPPQQKTAVPYPLCHSGWCLTRLRTTCELWRFVRADIFERVWVEETHSGILSPQQPPRRGSGFTGLSNIVANNPLRLQSRSTPSAPATDGSSPATPMRKNAGSGMGKVGSLFEKGLGALGVDMGTSQSANSNSAGAAGQTKDAKSPETSSATRSATLETPRRLPPPPDVQKPDATLPPGNSNSTAPLIPAPPLPARHRPQPEAPSPATPTASKTALPVDASEKPSTAPATTNPTVPSETPKEEPTQAGKGEFAEKAFNTIDLAESPISDLRSTAHKPVDTPVEDSKTNATKPPNPSAAPARPATPPRTSSPSPKTPARGTPPPNARQSVDLANQATPGAPPPIPKRAAARRPLPTPGGGPGSRPGSPAPGTRPAPGSRPGSPALPASSAALNQPGSPSAIPRPGTPTKSPRRLSLPKLGLLLGSKDRDKETKRQSIDAMLATESPSAPAKEQIPEAEEPPESSKTDTTVGPPNPVAAASVPPEPTKDASPVQAAEVEIPRELPAANRTSNIPTPSTEASKSTDSFASALAEPKSPPIVEGTTPKPPLSQPAPVDAPDPIPPPLPRRRESEVQSASSVYSKTADGDDRDGLDDALGNFIGDKTWEERSWKELVRLRTEMHWARIGSCTV